MKTIIDFHIHSRFSRACSKDLTLPKIAEWCERKGIGVVGTGDFTHPKWREEIEAQLVESEPGLFSLADGSSKTRFLLTVEISSIYKQGGKVRCVHNVVVSPSLEAAERFVSSLESRGANLKSDGRPILGISSRDLLSLALESDARTLFVPAHAWTPWFSIFGSESGFDSIEECFGDDLAKEIHAIETGLSSDPPMNWRLSALDRVMLVSNSDAHSPRNLGREANVMDLESLSYDSFAKILREHDVKRFVETLEFFPEEGKYHADGHRACGVRLLPEETVREGGKCPKCGKPVTVGVLNRVAAIADREYGSKPTDAVPFRHLIPLEELIAEAVGKGRGTKTVQDIYMRMTGEIAPEFELLLDYPLAEIGDRGPAIVVEALRRLRAGEVRVLPGYDGEFGTIRIFSDEDRARPVQANMF